MTDFMSCGYRKNARSGKRGVDDQKNRAGNEARDQMVG